MTESAESYRFADLESHHIEGWVEGFRGLQRIPLISHIEGDFWMGGCIDGTGLPDHFRSVVSLYPLERYRLAPGTERHEFPFKDAAFVPELGELYRAARTVLDALREGPTLVHCQAGLNRSGLVAGLALVLEGREPDDTIALLRSRRSPAVLCNSVFDHWLRTINRDELPVASLLEEATQVPR